MTLKAVVLPAPFGPIRLTISPSPTVKFMSESATSPPKCTATCSTLKAVARAAITRAPWRRARKTATGAPFSVRVALGKPLRQRRHDAARQHEQDDDQHAAIGDPLRLRRHDRPQEHRQQAEDHAADDGPGQRSLAAGDDHDHHRDRVDEGEHVGIDDPDVVRIEAAGRAGDRRPRSPPPASASSSRRCRPRPPAFRFPSARAWRGRNANEPGARSGHRRSPRPSSTR